MALAVDFDIGTAHDVNNDRRWSGDLFDHIYGCRSFCTWCLHTQPNLRSRVQLPYEPPRGRHDHLRLWLRQPPDRARLARRDHHVWVRRVQLPRLPEHEWVEK